jgi:serine/threonine-protein kinase
MAGEPPSAFVPSSFGRYQLLERIAVGGMAEIFRAKQTGAHGVEKTLVIKRILPHLAADPEFLAMFIDEAKLQCALAHPKVVQVFEFGEFEGQHFIALEYVDGVDALGLLRACAHRRQRLPVKLAVYIACDVLDALDFAHAMKGEDGHPLGIVHRDVSPSNIFLSRRGDVKLGDFGIARASEKQRRSSKTQAGTLKGKYGYMAPEQVVGVEIDGRADLFALGIVLTEMLMGRRLFTGPTDLDVLLMVRDARLDRLNRYGGDIPAPLRALLDRMLARDREQRFATAGQMRDALQDFLFDARLRATPTDLAAFLDGLLTVAPPRSEDSGLLMVGENTRAKQEEAARQRLAVKAAATELAVAQRAQELADSGPIEISGIVEVGLPSSLPSSAISGVLDDEPQLQGTFGAFTPARLFAGLATQRETGQLILERSGVLKEIFLVDGAPEFVASNIPSERFGEYLVSKGVISPGELSMALAILPRFQGKLGDTLVGLSLLRPLEVFRHLTRQVREKIIDVFGWTDGRYRFFRGRLNHREAFPLGLDAFEILGAGVAGLPLTVVRGRLDAEADRRVRYVERARPTPEQFRVGAGPRELWQRLDGKRTVGDWMRRYEQPEQLLTLCRTLYLLIESELAAVE